MSNAEIRGRFVWHELMTTDTDAASDFYSHVVPWKAQDSGMPSYKLWMSGKYQAGGLMAYAPDYVDAHRRAGENDRIVVFGSFLTVAGVMEARKSGFH